MSSSLPPLGSVPTGAGLGARLAAVEVRSTPDVDLLDVLAAEARQLAHQQARVWAVMAELATRNPLPNVPEAITWTAEQVFDSAVEEVRAELRLTARGAAAEVQRAVEVQAVPQVADALAAGRIDRARAVVLAEACADLTPERQDKLLAVVLPGAGAVTCTGLAARVRRVAMALDPVWAERRYRDAIRQRRVIGYLNDDGSATISGQGLPADQAALACARVAALAAAAKRVGAHAPIDHLRAELFLGLLDGRFQHMDQPTIIETLRHTFPKPDTDAAETPTEDVTEPAAETPAEPAPEPETAPAAATGVELRVELSTLLGLDDHPGELAGWGPIPAAVARELAGRLRHCEWRFAITDDHGRLLFDGLTRHRPDHPAPTDHRIEGGIVELQVPASLLTDPDLPMQFPAWARLLADLTTQYAQQRPIEQDPAARFPGRPLRRHSQIRHRTCLFPGCRRPAAQADQDHRHDHGRGGQTTEQNLGPGCRHDHTLKTSGGWRLIKREQGSYLWISPLGRKHHVEIDPITPPLPDPLPRPPDPDPPPF
jgi:hypothetical protein